LLGLHEVVYASRPAGRPTGLSKKSLACAGFRNCWPDSKAQKPTKAHGLARPVENTANRFALCRYCPSSALQPPLYTILFLLPPQPTLPPTNKLPAISSLNLRGCPLASLMPLQISITFRRHAHDPAASSNRDCRWLLSTWIFHTLQINRYVCGPHYQRKTKTLQGWLGKRSTLVPGETNR